MSQAIQSLFGSYGHTKTFSYGEIGLAETAANEVTILRFERASVIPASAGRCIDDLADDWARDAAFEAQLRAARMRRARSVDPTSLKGLRLSRGLSQAELARALGTSQSHVARIEGGTSCPTFETGRKLGRALGVDMNTLDRLLPKMHDSVEVCS